VQILKIYDISDLGIDTCGNKRTDALKGTKSVRKWLYISKTIVFKKQML
jgi:hypothetical protein